MKRLVVFTLLAMFALRACKGQTPQLGTHHTLSSTWSITGTTDWPAVYCSTTATAKCIKGFTEKITPPTGATAIAPFVLTGATLTHDYTPGGVLNCGTWSVSVVANWLDDAGAPVDSTPAIKTVNEACAFVASPANGLAITLK